MLNSLAKALARRRVKDTNVAQGREEEKGSWCGPLTSRDVQHGDPVKPEEGLMGNGVGKFSIRIWVRVWEERSKQWIESPP